MSRLLIDNSAWSRLHPSIVGTNRLEEIGAMFTRGEVVTSLPFRLEAGYPARTGTEHQELEQELVSLPSAPLTETIEGAVFRTQGQLSRAGHHRLPPVDLTIAALADHYGHGVLHYDSDYDLIREKTDLDYESVWLASRGSL